MVTPQDPVLLQPIPAAMRQYHPGCNNSPAHMRAACRWLARRRYTEVLRSLSGTYPALCSRLLHMDETRTEKISVNLTPSVLARLDAMRAAGAGRVPRRPLS